MKENVIKRIQNSEEKMNEKLKCLNIEVKILDFHYNDGIMLIIKDSQIIKVFILRGIALGQVNILENEKMIEEGIYIEDLDKWIYNLYHDDI